MSKLIVFVVWVVFLGCDGSDLKAWAAKSPRQSQSVSRQQSVTPGDFQKILLSELNRRFGRPEHHLTLNILFPKQSVLFPSGKRQFEVAPITDGGRTGRRAFRVSVFVNKKFMKIVNVVGELKAKAQVVIPSRWLKPHEVIEASDVTKTTLQVPSLSHDYFFSSHAVIGKQVLRPLSPQQPIRKIAVEDPPQIHKGDRVMLEVRSGGLLVQTVGLARATGKTGDTIPVKNQHSGREVLGRVVAAGLVQVGF